MSEDRKIIFSMVGVSKVYPPQKKVLSNIYLSFFYGAKIGVIGLNGSGKSSLLRIMAGVDKEFNGETVLAPGFTIGYLEQEPLLDETRTVRQVVEEGVQDQLALMREYDEINARFAEPMDDEALNKLIERQGEVQRRVTVFGRTVGVRPPLQEALREGEVAPEHRHDERRILPRRRSVGVGPLGQQPGRLELVPPRHRAGQPRRCRGLGRLGRGEEGQPALRHATRLAQRFPQLRRLGPGQRDREGQGDQGEEAGTGHRRDVRRRGRGSGRSPCG